MDSYKALELAGDHEACWATLVRVLRQRGAPPIERRREAEQMRSSFWWTNNIDSFHLAFKEAAFARRKANLPLTESEISIKHLGLQGSMGR
jgi:hypothetical protein